MARSLNKVTLIGNLTRDPELRYTPQGTAVCTFGLATNRQWTTESGEKREEADFHRIVSWNKLAELCAQLLTKGRKTYVEGRIQTRSWTAKDGTQRTTTEIVISNMIILDSRRGTVEGGTEFDIPETEIESLEKAPKAKEKPTTKTKTKKKKTTVSKKKTKTPKKRKKKSSEDIPF
jgi:single-strand DNA-binding protein